jgi:hypothetical protein
MRTAAHREFWAAMEAVLVKAKKRSSPKAARELAEDDSMREL